MDFSASNITLWNGIIQFGIIAGIILLANLMRRKIPLVRKSLMPTAVLAGFLLLIIRSFNIVMVETSFLEMITYHGIALGFIALSLRKPDEQSASGGLIGSKSGALIVSTYLVQGALGLIISIGLAYTIMPDLFKASGILLPMAYGQGPGQANNVGLTYEALGMTGGRSFGLSLAAAGYLCACVVGVVFLYIYSRKGLVKWQSPENELSGSVTVDTFQDENEIPISESVDKLSVQVALVALIYLVTYLITWGITSLLEAVAPGVGSLVSPILWGFNFITGSVIAIACRALFKGLRTAKLMTRQYQNNYLLSRISGLAFDLMIIAGIASINFEDLTGYWLPFLIMAILGGIVTFVYLRWLCNKVYPKYSFEGFFSMYGMLCGTISSGILLLREIDPEFRTPAANNLITGSSFAIVFGAPVMLLIALAPRSDTMALVTLGLILVYLAALLLYIFKVGNGKKKKDKA
jgi:ESS family glutamate:Na+ symporter